MITSLNEEYLLKFLYRTEEISFSRNSEFINLLNKFDVDIDSTSSNSLYDIIEKYEDE